MYRGFNEVVGSNANGVYYQSWAGKIPTVNTGSLGLQNFGERLFKYRCSSYTELPPEIMLLPPQSQTDCV